MPRKLLVGGIQRNGTLKGLAIKKVAPPTVPLLPIKVANQKRSPSIFNGDLGDVTPDFDESYPEDCFPKPPRSPSGGLIYSTPPVFAPQHFTMKKMMTSGPGAGSNGQVHLAHVIVHSQPDSLPSTPVEASSHSPSLVKGRLMSGTQSSLCEDQGIEVSSPGGGGRHSPGGSSSGASSVSRHSLSSLDSGRASSNSSGPGSDGKAINRRLSVHSYESGSPQRRSYHSSSSSLASGGGGEEGVAGGPNVAEMVLHGLPDVEVLSNWLVSLHFEEYISLFLQAGYDMPTITRMTPEDLTAIGITKPNHRRKMKAEIAKLNISDGIPEYKPNNLLEWLQLLRLEEYYNTLCHQHYDTVDRVTELTWEDLEDIGIQKLGHQKKILLAIKRIEDINQGRRPNLYPQSMAQQHLAQQHLDMQTCGSATFPRPSTLGSIQPYHYPSQEIAISTHRPKSSPSTDSIPELKTFQQSPVREDNTFTHSLHGSSQNVTSYQQNGSANPTLSPCRGRSLESLPTEDSASVVSMQQPVMTYTPAQTLATEQPKVQPKDWRVTDLDTDYAYECEGTATLNRPKGLVKLRPVAKITAKTRDEIAEAIMDIPDKEFKSLISQTRTLDGWSSLDGSPRHGPSTVPRASTLRRPPPPPPPKRSNSTKGERPVVDTKREDVSGVKLKASQFGITAQKLPAQGAEMSSSTTAEEFPPPPSPLPSAVEADKTKLSSVPDKSEPMDELFNNPLFRQRRKDSAESSSSVDSAALPFANETVGTIKQKTARPYPSLPMEHERNFISEKRHNGQQNPSGTNEEHEYDTTPDTMSPGDVIDDIEHMLANLSDQLDAMLDVEQIQK